MTQLVDKLDTRIAKKTKETSITTMKNLEDDHNLTVVQGAMKRVFLEVLMAIIDDEEVKGDFEAAVIQMATISILVKALAKTLATEEAILTLVARSVAS